ncbi:putative two-component response regulator-like APRR6 [Eutrema salsugineum]|uniref:putative two-component response regulator-like APRR6 n=1 Tax=Eutrema salsugineum TaxID=72664 RepID=UPI000CED0C99|nr:putative two-component response regulator-like APRR6 [Eutrema salsugineum]
MTEKLSVNLAGNTVPERIGDISVLLIDNDTISIGSLTSMLKQFSYKVVSVNMASEALSMIEKQKDIGLVIANIEMPHIDSHSFLTALLHKEIPLILISPEMDNKEASDLLTKSAHFCLKKPISENDIKNLWQHVVPKKSQELEKINITEQQEKVVEKSILNQIESFRETIKRQRTSQSSLLGRRPFVKTFTTPETYQKRNGKSNVGRRCNVWTQDRQMKFLTAISILGEKDSRPKSILSIMNDSDLNLRQVGSHLQKYKAQVELMNDSLSKNEWRSTDKTFNYPSDYEYPFNASNLAKNIVKSNTKWYSLKKKEASSSSIDQYSFKKSAGKEKARMMPKFHLGGKLDLSKHSFFDNMLNKSPMEAKSPSATSNNPPSHISSTNYVNNSVLSSDNPPVLSGLPSSVGASNYSGLSDNPLVLAGLPSIVSASNHSGLSSDNPPVLSGLPSSVGASNHSGLSDNSLIISGLPSSVSASNTDALQICTPHSEPNPFQPSSSVLEFDWNQLDLNQMGRVSSGENHVLPQDIISSVSFASGQTSYENPSQTNTTTILETNTDQMDWLFSEESFLLLEDMPSFETNTTQSLEINMEDMGLVPYMEDNDVPIEELISFDIDVNEMDIDYWLGNYGSSEENIPLSTRYTRHDSAFNTLTCGYQNMGAENPREAMEGGVHFDDDPEDMSWIDEMINDNA